MLKYYFRMLITIQNRGWMVLSALAQHVKKMWSWMSLNMFKLGFGGNIMAKYRKKPVVIEAFQYDGDLKDCDGNWYVPNWAVEAYEKGVMHYASESCDAPPCELFIETLEGIHHVSVWDYVIKGVNGELYPCKPDIFEKTYENI
jgi:hypothetical protein